MATALKGSAHQSEVLLVLHPAEIELDQLPALGDITLGWQPLLCFIAAVCIVVCISNKQRHQLEIGVVTALMIVLSAYPLTASVSDSTRIQAATSPGEFSLSQPNDVPFELTLNGNQQTVRPQAITTTVTDYRGIKSGWQLLVKELSIPTERQPFQVTINEQPISHVNTLVYDQVRPTVKEVLTLVTSVTVFSEASAGTYLTQLQWQLQPQVITNITE
ncbi:hypothetical protein BCAMP_03990 [Brochothrix campestris FSL F6-1037]|uniref:Uncharacterized protein n=1 Tax=Brochothrix campestris FSL F6-1037 TaxID=1265861 RepID=W7CNM9_9LIST|nr:hypothetical protein BCAMP_03990 [Brochothrix campestris FSL F6-1037]